MFSSFSRCSTMFAAAACLVGLGAGLLTADVPADYKGKPWKDTAQTVPGTVMLANFDEGGEGVGYHAAYPRAGGNFRPKEALSCSNASHDQMQDTKKPIPSSTNYVGWTAEGQWMQYTVDVQKTGTYNVSFIASSFKNDNEEISLAVNGTKKCTFKLAATSDYHQYKLNKDVAEVTLEKGKQLLKVTIEKQQHAANLLSVELVEKVAEVKDTPKKD